MQSPFQDKNSSEVVNSIKNKLQMPIHEWLPKKPSPSPENIVLGVHGLGGHGEWFDNLATRIADAGIPFYSFDLRGFGLNNSECSRNCNNPRGFVDSYKDWLHDIQCVYESLKSIYPTSKITLIGHSLGAVLLSALDGVHKQDQIVLSVPGYKGHSDTFSPTFIFNTFLKFIAKKLRISKNDYVTLPIANCPGVSDPSDNDPLKVYDVSAKLLLEILLLGEAVKKNISNITTPVLVIQAEDDIVVCNKSIDEHFERISSTQKSKASFSNALHDWIWYDSVDEISDHIVKWIKGTEK